MTGTLKTYDFFFLRIIDFEDGAQHRNNFSCRAKFIYDKKRKAQ